MTEEELAAIEARAAMRALPMGYSGTGPDDIIRLEMVDDVPALIAEIRRLNEERHALLKRYTKLDGENDLLRGKLAEARAEALREAASFIRSHKGFTPYNESARIGYQWRDLFAEGLERMAEEPAG